MTKKTKKTAPQKQSPLQMILGAVAIVIAGIVFLVSGVDLTGGQLSGALTNVPTATVSQSRATAAPASTALPTVPVASGNARAITLENGVGASRGFWQVYFTVPQSDRTKWVNGIDAEIAKAIAETKTTLDIAAFEWNNPTLTQAVLEAHQRGVRVRMVADNEHTIEDSASTLKQLVDAGIPIVYDQRSAFMHNKFMVMDGLIVWMGSMNYQQNDLYRNNNNVLRMRSKNLADLYTKEFETMFTSKVFGPRKTANTGSFTQDGVNIQVYFAPQNDVINPIVAEVANAKTHVRFMAFSYTQDTLGQAMLDSLKRGVKVEGVFEQRGSETASSELKALKCAGANVFQDGNGATMHHKVIIIDDHTVITGSFNFSDNAVSSNDENLLIIKDRDIVLQYLAEYERVMAIAKTPDKVTC